MCRVGGARTQHLRRADGQNTLCGRPVRDQTELAPARGPLMACFACYKKRRHMATKNQLPKPPNGYVPATAKTTGKTIHLATSHAGEWPLKTVCGKAIRELYATQDRPTCAMCAKGAN